MKSSGAIRGERAREFSKRASGKPWTDAVGKFIVPAVGPNSKMKIADFCTGSGNIIPFFDGLVKEFVAIDASEEMIKILKEKYGKSSNIKIIKSDVSKVPLKSKSYDRVISKFGYHHIGNIDSVNKEAYRILKKGGRFVVFDCVYEGSFWNKYKLHIMKFKKSFELGKQELFCKYRSDKTMIKSFELAGFKVVENKRVGFFGKGGFLVDYLYVLEK